MRRTPAQKRADEQAAHQALVSDASKTAARYHEIVALRMLLLDILDEFEDQQHYRALRKRINHKAKTWGKKGDCV